MASAEHDCTSVQQGLAPFGPHWDPQAKPWPGVGSEVPQADVMLVLRHGIQIYSDGFGNSECGENICVSQLSSL
jgi:hypothetical protein